MPEDPSSIGSLTARALASTPSPPANGAAPDRTRTPEQDARQAGIQAWRTSGLPERHRRLYTGSEAERVSTVRYLAERHPRAPREALARATAALASSGSVVLLGPRGTGKTQLAAGLALHWAAQGVEGRSIRYHRLGDVAELERGSFNGKAPSPLPALRNVGLLVLDEVQDGLATAWEQALFTSLIDSRYGAMLPTVVVTNAAAGALTALLGASAERRLREDGVLLECAWERYA